MKYHVTNTKCYEIAHPIHHVKELMELRAALHDDPLAIALAAPQIGHNMRAFAIRSAELPMSARNLNTITLMINPVIIEHSSTRNTLPEICRSASAYGIPKLDRSVPVSRYDVVRLRYSIEHGTGHTATVAGYTARIVQHEIDHLNGLSIYG